MLTDARVFSVVTDDVVLLLAPLLRQQRHARFLRLNLGITITEMHVALNETMCKRTFCELRHVTDRHNAIEDHPELCNCYCTVHD